MFCPACRHSKTAVLETRDQGDWIKRRRQCQKCQHRFNTEEREKRGPVRERQLPLFEADRE